MHLVLTIKAKVFGATRRKREALEALWRSWKSALTLPRDYQTLRKSTDLPSRYCREMSWKVPIGADSPVGPPKDSFNIRPGGTFAPWFISITTPKGRIHLPLRMAAKNARLLGKVKLGDCRLVKSGQDFYLHLAIEREVLYPVIPSHGVVLAVDIGERVIATSVALVDGSPREPRFHGRDVRGIRRHYSWLRRRLGRGISSGSSDEWLGRSIGRSRIGSTR